MTDDETTKKRKKSRDSKKGSSSAKKIKMPDVIDYSLGVILVDVVPTRDWKGSKNLQARYYFNMLYTKDGSLIEQMPIKSKYWSEDLQARFNEIKRSEKETKEPLRPYGSRRAGSGRQQIPGGGGRPGMGRPGMGRPGM